MRRKLWVTLALVTTLPAMLLMTSCAQKTTVQSQSVQTTQAEVAEGPTLEEKSDEVFEIPDETVAAPEANETEFVSENIRFAFDSFQLSAQSRRILNSNVEYLNTNPRITVTVEGYCDERGTDAYNLALGERRAKSVKDFLVNMGVEADRLNTVSYGEERPIAFDHEEASWAKNRRVQLVLSDFPEGRISGMPVVKAQSRNGE